MSDESRPPWVSDPLETRGPAEAPPAVAAALPGRSAWIWFALAAIFCFGAAVASCLLVVELAATEPWDLQGGAGFVPTDEAWLLAAVAAALAGCGGLLAARARHARNTRVTVGWVEGLGRAQALYLGPLARRAEQYGGGRWTFRLERFTASGDRLGPVPVWMRGDLEAVLRDGDEVEVVGTERRGGAIEAFRVRNVTTGGVIEQHAGRLTGTNPVLKGLAIAGVAGSLAILVVGDPLAEDVVKVPKLVGQRYFPAIAALDAAGLRHERMDVEHRTARLGRVVRTDPAAGSVVHERSKVRLYVQSGFGSGARLPRRTRPGADGSPLDSSRRDRRERDLGSQTFEELERELDSPTFDELERQLDSPTFDELEQQLRDGGPEP